MAAHAAVVGASSNTCSCTDPRNSTPRHSKTLDTDQPNNKNCLLLQVAQAPKSSGPRIQAMSELEQDQGILPSKPDSEDIDLSLLTACLLPSDQVSCRPQTADRQPMLLTTNILKSRYHPQLLQWPGMSEGCFIGHDKV